ncbi:DEKNAAC103407 [Brettanomyces naardenensis]|uniref:Carboxypeptidase n=1 Tax=Brettanomyces naardenensis TaxID=13370 RepID=A0A448YNA1_BRENA|nr:DEKNAAC103407 [Brettanomyces naardenensis]
MIWSIHKPAFVISCLLVAVIAAPVPTSNNSTTSKENAKFLVKDLPGLSDIPESMIPEMHAGQLDLPLKNDTGLFFWRFGRQQTLTDDLVIWFNGGPGCSSMDGAMMEIGPFRPSDKDGSKLTYNNGTWLDSADLLFVDQPIGTGFAYTDVDYDRELTEASQHMVEFFKEYLNLFPSDGERNIWIAGESYAGQYIPYFADAILREQEDDPSFHMNIQGLLIGNGWIDPDIQSLSYVPFAMKNKLLNSTNPMFQKVLSQHEKCQNAINDPENTEFEKTQCDKVLDIFTKATKVITDQNKRGTCFNVYDYRKQDIYPSCGANWPEILPSTETYLNLEDVQKALNLVHRKEWTECNNRVSMLFSPKKSVKALELLPDLLSKVSIMLFNGDKDIICNHLGTEMMIERLNIGGGQIGFSDDSGSVDWVYAGENVGEVRNEMNLTYVRVFNSSHMVPYDLPEISRGLLDIMFQLDTSKGFESSVVTPVHDINVGRNGQQHGSSKSGSAQSASSGHFALEVAIFAFAAVDIYIIYLFFVRQRHHKSSFLNSNGQRRKKRVHWTDDSQDSFEDTEDDGGEENNSVLYTVLSKLGYKGQYKEMDTEGGDIEMGDVTDDQFVIQSEDEDENGDGDGDDGKEPGDLPNQTTT